MAASERACETFVDVWADEVRRLVPQVKELREAHDRDSRAMDYGEDWSPDEHDMYASWRRLWAAQHHLVWAANQLERWVSRLATERGTPVPEPDAVLADLRNALEHLDEAVLDDDHALASAGDNPKANRSLRNLPGAKLHIGTGGPRLFDLIDSAEIERRAFGVVTTTDRMIEEAGAWASDLMARGEWPPWADVDPEEEY